MALEYRIGGQDFPLRPGSPPYLRDPIADALLDFLAFCLNDALNVQLAAMSPKRITDELPQHPELPECEVELAGGGGVLGL